MSKTILEVKNLRTAFRTDSGEVTAVDDVSLSVKEGQTLGIVGESGCGKSVTALSIMRLIPSPPGRVVSGQILFKGEDLLQKPIQEMRQIRGNKIGMIFQEPMTSLNPVFTIGDQVMESVRLHQGLNKKDALSRAIEMLKLVGIPAPERRVNDYPHQLSGGMRQRVMIAMALACNPALLIADEPTTALDVTIQAQILDLLASLRQKLGMAVVLITHDLGVVAEVCESVVVMYAGKVVEKGSVEDIFLRPTHPYTRGLLNSLPSLAAKSKRNRLETIPGLVPSLNKLPKGCRFADRCSRRTDRCVEHAPVLERVGTEHEAACFHPFRYDSSGAVLEREAAQ